MTEWNEVEARRWEIAENLHRAELTALERAEHIAEWVRLTEPEEAKPKPGQVAQVSPRGGRGVEGGISAASRELGVERTEARRATKIAAIAPAAKEAARAAGLDGEPARTPEGREGRARRSGRSCGRHRRCPGQS